MPPVSLMRRRLGLLALVLGLLTPLGASAQGDPVFVTVGATLCPDLDRSIPDETTDLSSCIAGAGITITGLTRDDGQDFGSCVTEGSIATESEGSYASCRIDVPADLPDETVLVFELDYRTVPDGYMSNSLSGHSTVVEARNAPDTPVMFYNLPEYVPGPTGPTGYPITAYLCETDPGNWSPYSAREIGGGCEPSPGIRFDVTAEVDAAYNEPCITDENGTCYLQSTPYDMNDPVVLTITEDVSTLPEGYTPRDNPMTGSNSTEFRGTTFVNVLAAGDSSGQQPTATEPLTPATDGSNAAIYAGDCDADLTAEPVATLTNVRPPDGDTAGAEGGSAVETSSTTLDLPLDDVLADDHVLVVFDEDDDTVPIACGAIGGIVADDGSLAIGLPLVGESRYAGIAYLTPDGDQTDVTVFLAENLSGAGDTPGA